MKISMKRFILAIGLLAGLCLQTPFAYAEDPYPNRAIKIVVPTGAGGITDILARIVGQQLSIRLGQPVYVDNKPGASGILGSDLVAKSAPDGYTLVMVFPVHPVNPSLFAKLPYDTSKDFLGISPVTSVSLVLLTSPTSENKSVKELIQNARQNPGKINFGSVGNGSLGFLGAELFSSTANIKMTHIPYKGVPQALTALMGNEIDLYFDTPATAIDQIKGGKLKALGVSTKTRNPSLPDVPTITEAGLPGYEVTSWNGLLAPAGTPSKIINLLNKEMQLILTSPEIKSKFSQLGVEPFYLTPNAFDELVRADIVRWKQVLKNANIKPE